MQMFTNILIANLRLAKDLNHVAWCDSYVTTVETQCILYKINVQA
jgi:hypothetical protein